MADRTRSSCRSSTRAETCRLLRRTSRGKAAAARAPNRASREGGGGEREREGELAMRQTRRCDACVWRRGGAPATRAEAAAGQGPCPPQQSAHLGTSVYQAPQCPESVLRSAAHTRTACALSWKLRQPPCLAATGAETGGRRRQHDAHPASDLVPEKWMKKGPLLEGRKARVGDHDGCRRRG